MHLPDLCKSLGSFSDCLDALGKAEINKDLEQAFGSFATAQRSVKEIVDEQLNADQYHLGNTIDEYVRLMGAVKVGMIHHVLSLILANHTYTHITDFHADL